MSRHPAVKVTDTWAMVYPGPKPSSFDHRAILYRGTLDVAGLPADVDLQGAHASGKYNAPLRDVVEFVALLLTRQGVQVLTMTEAQQRGLVKALQRRLGSRYAVRKTGNYLCVIDRREFKWTPLRPARHLRMTRTKHMADWRNLFLGEFRIRAHACPSVPIVVSVGHAPAGIESGSNYRRGTSAAKAVATHKAGMTAWGRWLDARARTTVAIAVGDGNADLKRASWRTRFRAYLGPGLVWDEDTSRGRGSHGNRLIDFALIRTGGRR